MSTDYKKTLAANYKKDSIDAASPGRLVLMLYDGALRFLDITLKGFELEDQRERNEVVNTHLIKTQNILSELQSSLDMSVPGEFSKTMFRLYDFMIRQLQLANIRKEIEPVKVVKGMLKDVRDSWDDMLRKTNDGKDAVDEKPVEADESATQPMAGQAAPAPAKKNSNDERVGGGLDASA